MSRRTFVQIEIAFLLSIPTGAFILECVGIDSDPFATMFMLAYFYLVVGWALFLLQVVPHIVMDWFSLGLAGV